MISDDAKHFAKWFRGILDGARLRVWHRWYTDRDQWGRACCVCGWHDRMDWTRTRPMEEGGGVRSISMCVRPLCTYYHNEPASSGE